MNGTREEKKHNSELVKCECCANTFSYFFSFVFCFSYLLTFHTELCSGKEVKQKHSILVQRTLQTQLKWLVSTRGCRRKGEKSSSTRVNNFRATNKEKKSKWSESKGSAEKNYIKKNQRKASVRTMASAPSRPPSVVLPCSWTHALARLSVCVGRVMIYLINLNWIISIEMRSLGCGKEGAMGKNRRRHKSKYVYSYSLFIHTFYRIQKTRNRPWIFRFCSPGKWSRFRFIIHIFFSFFVRVCVDGAHDNWANQVCMVFIFAWTNCVNQEANRRHTRIATESMGRQKEKCSILPPYGNSNAIGAMWPRDIVQMI